jgi:hypothetical protein
MPRKKNLPPVDLAAELRRIVASVKRNPKPRYTACLKVDRCNCDEHDWLGPKPPCPVHGNIPSAI